MEEQEHLVAVGDSESDAQTRTDLVTTLDDVELGAREEHSRVE